jgi:hypothetical protein
MDYDQLKKLLREWKINLVPKEVMRVRGFDVDSYREMARETERVDYDCDFSNGVCRGLAMGTNGCCSGCAAAFGYWRKEGNVLDEDTVYKLMPFYDEKTGFMKEGSGCIIPRELRSPTCLYIFCSDDMMSGEDRLLLYRIQYGAHWS